MQRAALAESKLALEAECAALQVLQGAWKKQQKQAAEAYQGDNAERSAHAACAGDSGA